MPFYRINGMLVHLKLGGKKHVQPCGCPIELDGKRQRCLGFPDFYCDWETGPGQTCSAPLCRDHATQVGPDLHLCPEHMARRGGVPVVQDGLL
jgi:hypothetical protein